MTAIFCTSEQVPMDRNTGTRWLGFNADTPDAVVRAKFAARYGGEPETIKRLGGAVLAGPVPEKESR